MWSKARWRDPGALGTVKNPCHASSGFWGFWLQLQHLEFGPFCWLSSLLPLVLWSETQGSTGLVPSVVLQIPTSISIINVLAVPLVKALKLQHPSKRPGRLIMLASSWEPPSARDSASKVQHGAPGSASFLHRNTTRFWCRSCEAHHLQDVSPTCSSWSFTTRFCDALSGSTSFSSKLGSFLPAETALFYWAPTICQAGG